jgi:hypothetical protein
MACQWSFRRYIVANKLRTRLDSTHAFAREVWRVCRVFPAAKLACVSSIGEVSPVISYSAKVLLRSRI